MFRSIDRWATRRQLIKGVVVLGVASTILGPLLAACTRVGKPLSDTVARSQGNIAAVPPTMVATPTVAGAAASTLASPKLETKPTPIPITVPSPRHSEKPGAPSTLELPSLAGDLTDHQAIGHLLRRAGFGAGADIHHYQSLGLQETINELVDYESVDDSALDHRLSKAGFDFELRSEIRRWWLLRMAYTRRPLQEKMTLFWHGFLTSGISKVGDSGVMLTQNFLLRKHALGNYQELLKAIGRDAAMLRWLDSRTNKKQAPNENYARELMELFTLSPGHYTEEDVREAARAFTGWGLSKKSFSFRPSHHDFGQKVVLGSKGNHDGDDVVDIILRQPQAARFIAGKLFGFFAYPDPEPEVVDRLANTFTESHYSIRDVVRAIFMSPEFYSARAYKTRIKSPIEFVVGTARAMEVDTLGKGYAEASGRMGQLLFDPPDVAGWPGGPAWVDSSAILQRVNFANIASSRNVAILEGSPSASMLRAQLTYRFLDGVSDPTMEDALDRFELGTRGSSGLGINRGILYLYLAGPSNQMG